MHVPQSVAAETELAKLASVTRLIVSPRLNAPIIQMVQDTLTGAYRISNPNVKIHEQAVMNMLSRIRRPLGAFKMKGEAHSGTDVISAVFPPMTFNEKIKLENGRLVKGLLNKGAFNTPSEGILHVIFNDLGHERCGQFINEVQSIVTKFNLHTGFSTGASDLISNKETLDYVENSLAEGRQRVQEIITDVHSGRFVNISGRTDGDELENQIMNTLKQISAKITSKVSDSLPASNRLLQMVKAGAKGDNLNITQMVALLGQQIVDGKRIQFTLPDRTLPHFNKFDDSAESRGFVESSFVKGLRPAEYFFHAMGGREGLIDTAVKTSDTGYIQRRMMKTMEDLHVEYDGTVRNNSGVVIQYQYGEDGIDSTAVESQSIPLGMMALEDIYKMFALSVEEVNKVLTEAVTEAPDMVEEIVRDRDMVVKELFGYNRKDTVLAPVHLKRMIDRYTNKYSTKTDLLPAYVVEQLESLVRERAIAPNRLFGVLLRYYLAPRKCIIDYRFSKDTFDEIIREIRYRYLKSCVHAGEMVGALAAQSIGEPTTQLTLNSVDWDERIIIAKNGKIVTTQIGEFVDDYMEKFRDSVQHLENDQLYLELNDGNDWKALSTDKHGNMVWTKLEAITSHPVVNEDGTSTILEVETESGRTVKATKGKSFLTVVDGELTATNGSALKLGDEIPVAASLATHQLPTISEISMRDILPPTEWVYGTEAAIALRIMKEENDAGNKYWWKQHAGKDFVVPYSRSDIFRDAFVNGHNTRACDIKEGFVYPKIQTCALSQIPETWVLDTEFGFFVGAYLAEGMSNRTQVNITNNDESYLNRVRRFTDSWCVGSHTVKSEKVIENTNIKGSTQSLILHSTLLAKVMGTLFGSRSFEKTMPDWVLQAPDTFVKGLIDGYISGDGTVSLKNCIAFSSCSEELVTRMNALLARYEIFTSTSTYTPEIQKFRSVRKQYVSRIGEFHTQIFAKHFTLSIAKKQERLNECASKGIRKFMRTQMSNVVLDKVKSIKETLPIKGRVYDLTVEGTRNFTDLNMLCLRDTFHSAGTVKAGATQGVPRIKELLDVATTLKNPLNFVYLEPAVSGSLDQAIMVQREIQKTTLRDITKHVRMYYDPYPLDTKSVVSDDVDILRSFQAFSVGKPECTSPWILRLEFDDTEMARRDMEDMVMIETAIMNSGLRIMQCIHSDSNSAKMVMRILFEPGVVTNMLSLRFMEDKVLDVVIAGASGVGRVYPRKVEKELTWDDSVSGFAVKTQYVLDVEGSNMFELMGFANVDKTRIFSNDIHEVLEVFGIEAARQALLDEFNEAFTDAYVNYHHMSVLLDSITYQGRLLSANRFGMKKQDNGILAKASFEETAKTLFNAAVSAEMDDMTGVSANIMFGQKPPAGTGFVQIVLDETRLPDGNEEEQNDLLDLANQRVAKAQPPEEGECKMEDILMEW